MLAVDGYLPTRVEALYRSRSGSKQAVSTKNHRFCVESEQSPLRSSLRNAGHAAVLTDDQIGRLGRRFRCFDAGVIHTRSQTAPGFVLSVPAFFGGVLGAADHCGDRSAPMLISQSAGTGRDQRAATLAFLTPRLFQVGVIIRGSIGVWRSSSASLTRRH